MIKQRKKSVANNKKRIQKEMKNRAYQKEPCREYKQKRQAYKEEYETWI